MNIDCPSCPPFKLRNGKFRGATLHVIERNYSGCDIDIFDCPQCKKTFSVSYKIEIDKIEEIK